MSFSKLLTDRILSEANKKNLSIKKLAENVDLPKSTIHNIIEDSRKNPTLNTLASIAIGLDMTVSQLLDFKEMNELTLDDIKKMKSL